MDTPFRGGQQLFWSITCSGTDNQSRDRTLGQHINQIHEKMIPTKMLFSLIPNGPAARWTVIVQVLTFIEIVTRSSVTLKTALLVAKVQ